MHFTKTANSVCIHYRCTKHSKWQNVCAYWWRFNMQQSIHQCRQWAVGRFYKCSHSKNTFFTARYNPSLPSVLKSAFPLHISFMFSAVPLFVICFFSLNFLFGHHLSSTFSFSLEQISTEMTEVAVCIYIYIYECVFFAICPSVRRTALVQPGWQITASHKRRHVWELQHSGGEGARQGKGTGLKMRTSQFFSLVIKYDLLWLSFWCSVS